MESPQTLHDFVLNLLSNADARAAFQLDPQGALHDAGLSDVDAADVRDVIPLVVDYAPTRAVPALDTTLNQLTAGAAGGGVAGAIQQLQLVTQQLPPVSQLANADFTMAATGTVAGAASGLTSLAGSLATTGGGLSGTVGLSGDFSPVNDVAHTLDATAVADATSAVSNTVTGTVAGTVDTTAGSLGGTLAGTPDVSHTLGTVTGVVTDTTHGLTGELSGVLGGTGLLGLSGGAGGSTDAATLSGSGSVDANAHTSATTTDSPLHHGVVGDLLGGTTSLLGAPEGHVLDVSHLF
ncbi:MAG: hypothetical protein V7603_4295 [Micromonosporaceae bacterium]